MLWLSGATSLVSFAAAVAIGEGSARWFLLPVGTLPIGATLVAYFMWALRDPDRLQSEEYMLEQQRILMMERKSTGDGPRIEAKPDMSDYIDPDSETEVRG